MRRPSSELAIILIVYPLVMAVLAAAITWDVFVLRNAHETPHITLGADSRACNTNNYETAEAAMRPRACPPESEVSTASGAR